MLTQKQEAALQKKVEAVLLSLGAKPDTESGYQFVLETAYGPLRLTAYATAIRTRFDKVPAHFPAGPAVNKFSGKWNFEFWPKPDQSDLDWAANCIAAIMPSKGAQK